MLNIWYVASPIFKYLLKYENYGFPVITYYLKHDFFMIDEHQNFIPIFVCRPIHGNLSKCLQTEDRTGCGLNRCRDIQKFTYMYKNKREYDWLPGCMEEIMACPRFSGLKQHREYILQDECLFG